MYDDIFVNIMDNMIAGRIRAMLGNIDNNSNNNILGNKLVQQDSLNNILGTGLSRRNSNNIVDNSNFLIDSSDISNKAMQMYQRELDIKNFTQLATSDPENTSHEKLMEELFSKGVVDVFEDNTVASLSTNKSLIDDLGL